MRAVRFAIVRSSSPVFVTQQFAPLVRRAEAEKQFESLIDRDEFVRRDVAKDPTDPPLVDRSQMIDERR